MDLMKICHLEHGDQMRTPNGPGIFVGLVRLKNAGVPHVLVCVQMPEIDSLTGTPLINGYAPELVLPAMREG